MPTPAPLRRARTVALALPLLLIAACSPAGDGPDAADATDPAAGTSGAVEAGTPTPRLAMSYDGGVLILDAESLEVVGDIPVDGFTRLNPAGDGRHILVSHGDGFTALDTGTWSVPHGDHAHHYVADPALTDVTFEASEAGHVVRHAGRTVLFSDGSGLVESFDPAGLVEGHPETETHTTAAPHHGVAVPLADGGLITTLGTADERSGIVVLDAAGQEVIRNEQCPGIHGEVVAADEAVVFGCEDGVLVYRDGAVTKVAAADAYGRIGNQAGSEESPIVLGDYKTDPDAELERPERVALVDTATAEITLVDLGVSYSFRSLGRGPHGEAIVLGTDGALHVIDPSTGAVTDLIEVVEPWTEPDAWQEPRPTLFVLDHTAYVTDPAASTIHAVDLDAGTVGAQAELPQAPNELTGVPG